MASAQRMKRLPDWAAGYIAGIIDGEGTITLTAQHKGEHRRLIVSVASTEPILLRFIRDLTGVGKITAKRVYSANHAPSQTYALGSRQALALLQAIAPYLRTYKKQRAELALKHYLRLTPRNGKYTPQLLAERAAFEREFLRIIAPGKTSGKTLKPSPPAPQ